MPKRLFAFSIPPLPLLSRLALKFFSRRSEKSLGFTIEEFADDAERSL
jgi:hypothetical protein